MRLLYIYLLECSKWKPEGPKKIWISFWRCLGPELASLGSNFWTRGTIWILLRVFHWPTSGPGGAGGRDARRGAQGLPQRTLAVGGPGPPTDGPPVSCPVSCPVSTGGFKPGFMGGLGRLVFRSWFHALKKKSIVGTF